MEMEIVVSLMAVAVAAGCLVTLLITNARERRRKNGDPS
jgi:hypothetical protein